MPLAQRGQLEAHLNDCADCRDVLNDLRRVSDLLAAAPLVELGPAAMTRFQQTWFAAAQDRGVMRIAGWLTSAAAAILIAALLIRPAPRSDDSLASALTAAISPPAAVTENDSADLIDAAQWMANDLTPDPAR